MCVLENAGIIKKPATRGEVSTNKGRSTTLKHLIVINLLLDLQQIIRFHSLFSKPNKHLYKHCPQLFNISSYISLNKKNNSVQKDNYNKIMDAIIGKI